MRLGTRERPADEDRTWLGIWRTRLARKIVVIFVISAAIPLAAFAGLGYFEGGQRIQAKLERDLLRDCRSTSLSLYERLLFLESELRLRGRVLANNEGTRRFASIEDSSLSEETWRREGFGSLERKQLERLLAGKPWIFVQNRPEALPEVYLIVRIGEGKVRIGRIAKSWLWSFGDHLPEGQELSVSANSLVLFTSTPTTPLPDSILEAGPILGGRELVSWYDGQEDRVSAFRDLFLARYGTAPWRVVQSTSKAQLLSPLMTFRDIFVWVGFLTLLLVAALSLRLIDLVLQPIRKLQTTVASIRNRDYSNRVEISSDDEFEELGGAFNAMLDEISDKILEVQMAARDLTVARDLAIDALQTQTLFIENVSHEFRTPTTSIQSFSEILRDFGPEDEATRREFLDIIISESCKLEGLVERVLDFSQLQVQEGLVAPTTFDPTNGLGQEFAQWEVLARERGLEFVLDLQKDLPTVLGEEMRLRQVWGALLSNAINFSGAQGRVTLRARSDGHALVVEVEDEGCGIPTELKDRIFDSFAQVADDTLTAKPTGQGLGLTIAARITQLHGGQIEVDSTPGQGSCFRIFIPASTTRHAQRLPQTI